MQQELVFFLHPTFLSSTFKTICSALCIINNFWATDPVMGPQVKQHELQTTDNRVSVAEQQGKEQQQLLPLLHPVSGFLVQWKVKRERHQKGRDIQEKKQL